MSAFLSSKHRPLWVAAAGLVLLPLAFQAVGLTLDSATVVIILAVAAMGLNLLVGYTGLVSFGHSAWFGIGGYAAGLAQLHWFKGQMLLPLLFSIGFTAVLSLAVGFLILRRRDQRFHAIDLQIGFAVAWDFHLGEQIGLSRAGMALEEVLLAFYAVRCAHQAAGATDDMRQHPAADSLIIPRQFQLGDGLTVARIRP